ncbi:MAG: DUF3667 domain-containing protein [Sphingomonadaceae bacterium]|nr:DUF3667 domain-containing protein [Sphingomonadaceae bacterium]
MSGELAGAADILTGAAIARAVEPDAGEGQATQGNCLNCGTALMGAHCHACGQKAKVHRTLHAFGHDILHSVLHFDGKIWRTLPMLAWNPGELTRRYVHGERAKFVSPLALFLFTVFLTFAVFNWLVPDSGRVNNVFSPDQAEAQYQEDRKEILDSIAELQADRRDADAEKQPGRDWMDGEIARHQKDLKALDESHTQRLQETGKASNQIAKAQADSMANIKRLESELQVARNGGRPTKAIESQLESERVDLRLMSGALAALGQNADTKDGEWTFTDLDFPGAASLNEAVRHAAENPQLMLYKIQSNAYKFSWALIPISVPFVWLLFFWRWRFKMFDHAVFVTYSLTFMMLLGIVIALFMQFAATEAIAGLMLVFVPPIHLYRHLHHAYETSRFGAFWRMGVLSVFAMTALTLFVTLIVALGVSG